MYFLDVMTFDPKLTKYIPCSVDHKKIRVGISWAGSKKSILHFYKYKLLVSHVYFGPHSY